MYRFRASGVGALLRHIARAACISNLVISLGMLSGCGGSDEPSAPPPVATSIQVSPATLSLEVGQTQQLSATVLDRNGQAMAGQAIVWSSSDTTRLTIDAAGVVRGVRPGTASVEARTGNVVGTAAASVSAPAFRFDESASATATLGPTGGVITARGPNNVNYKLTVPRRALRDTVSITLTPVTSLGNIPVHGVIRLRPSNLKFRIPVTVTVELSAPLANTAEVIGFHFADDGTTLSRYPVAFAGRELRFLLAHFSGVGAAGPPIAPLVPQPTTPAGQQNSAIATALQSGNVNSIIAAFRGYYTAVVKPMLIAANDVPTTETALGEWQWWLQSISVLGGNFSGQILTALGPEVADSRDVAAATLRRIITQENSVCIATQDLNHANDILFLQEQAEVYGIDTPQFGLDLATILQGLCVQVRYVAVTLPDTVRPGRAATLRVQAGISFGPAPPAFNPFRVEVTSTPSNTTDNAARNSITDGIGVVTRQVTPADTLPMTVSLRACLDPTLALTTGRAAFAQVCANTTITRTPTNVLYFNDFSGPVGAEWSPRTTATSPNGSQRFLGELGFQADTLTLNSLPPHTQLVLEFDLYIIDSWNGNGGVGSSQTPDILTFEVAGGPVIKRTTFSNKPRDVQAFPGDFPGASNPAGTGAFAKNALGYPIGVDFFGDASYRLRLVFTHTSSSITLLFGSQQTSGQNERWGLDNVRLSLAP